MATKNFDEEAQLPKAEIIRILRKVMKMPAAIGEMAEYGNLRENELIKPNDNSGEPKHYCYLLEETFDIALPKLMQLQKLYPEGSFITIGCSSDPASRDKVYNAKKEFYPRSYFSPKLKLEKQILYCSNSRYNALVVEYYMQYHMTKGLWKDIFSAVANPQRHSIPRRVVYEPKPTYVYAKFSKTKANWNV